ncbi:MAG TPA: YciI family protein [Symbiobacteriaceae bacterium]|nr:YciI family protein [Symbiobacteriaceae bacterium]
MPLAFLYRLLPVRPTLGFDATPEEDEIVGRHFSYLKGLLAEGRLVLAAPAADYSFGLTIFEAESEAEARAIMEGDPAVRNGIMTAELIPLKIALLRGRD